jgi:hypothetical protein
VRLPFFAILEEFKCFLYLALAVLGESWRRNIYLCLFGASFPQLKVSHERAIRETVASYRQKAVRYTKEIAAYTLCLRLNSQITFLITQEKSSLLNI